MGSACEEEPGKSLGALGVTWVIGWAQGRRQVEEGTGECWLHPAGEVESFAFVQGM